MLTELRAVHVEQPRAVPILLLLHLVEQRRRRRIGLAQAVGEVGVDAPVGLLERDREGEDFCFGEVAEVPGQGSAPER